MINKLDKLNKLRITRAKKIIKSLSSFEELNFNSSFEKKRHVYHLLSAFYKPSNKINRNDLIKLLYYKYKIQCATQYYPLYRYSLFKKMGVKKMKCKNSEYFYDNMISLPFHVWMSDSEINYIISSVRKSLTLLRKLR